MLYVIPTAEDVDVLAVPNVAYELFHAPGLFVPAPSNTTDREPIGLLVLTPTPLDVIHIVFVFPTLN